MNEEPLFPWPEKTDWEYINKSFVVFLLNVSGSSFYAVNYHLSEWAIIRVFGDSNKYERGLYIHEIKSKKIKSEYRRFNDADDFEKCFNLYEIAHEKFKKYESLY